MHIFKRKLILNLSWFLIFFSVTIAAFPQEKGPYQFQTFSPDGGFNYDGVKKIQQDKNGFMWILMANDLFRFDGYEYKSYYNNFKQHNNKLEKNFRDIIVDKEGHVYVSLNDGLYTYNRLNNTFSKIVQGDFNYLWAVTDNTLLTARANHLEKYDRDNNTFTNLSYQDKPLTNVHSIIPEENGFFILSWGRTIFRYNNDTKETSLFYAFEKDNYLNGFCKINNTIWCISSDNILYTIDIPTGKNIGKTNFLSPGETIYPKMMLPDKNDNIWIASQNGLYVYHTKTNTYHHYTHNKTDPLSLTNNSIWTLEEDAHGNIWIGTYSGGLSYVNLNKKNHFKSFSTKNSPLNHNLVSGFAEDSENLWIATEGGGINQVNKETNTYTFHTANNQANSIAANNVKSLIVDQNKNLWFATFRGGLGFYNPKTKHFKNFVHRYTDTNSILSNNLRKLMLDSDDGFWIVYQANKLQLSYYHFESETFTHYTIDNENPNHYIFDINEGSEGFIWILTRNKLYALNKENGTIKKIELPDSSLLYGQTLSLDGNENLWIGTVGKGLYRYNTKSGDFKNFDDILKFDVSTIYSSSLDFKNNLWLGTDNGLFYYNTAENDFFRFDKKDGVQGQVFYPLATYKTNDGKLFFGGTNGFTSIYPDEIIQDTLKPKASISNFFIDNILTNPPSTKDSLLNTTLNFPKTLELNHKQSNFGFTFTSDNYLIPQNNRFKYRLKGYDDRWIEVNAQNRNVFYSKVPPGTYTFEVAASNNDGIWGSTLKIKIDRHPAPWFSWWAFTLYFLIVFSTIFIIVRYYYNQKKLKMQLYLDHLNQEKKEEVHQSQLRFFTSISHDFRTPLSLISASIDKLREEGLKEYYYRILSSNTKRLLGLVNELMDFRTIENGKMPLQVTKSDINLLVKNFAFDFKDYALQHNINFNMTLDSNLHKEIYVDKHILEKVIMNLLNNAFKFTKNGGVISLSTYASRRDFHSNYKNSITISETNIEDNCFCIVIKDTGIGISEETLPFIFDPYYKVKSESFTSVFGTGIGLFIIKNLVLLHKGEITVFSEYGKGSDIIACFPLHANNYAPEHFLNGAELETHSVPPVFNAPSQSEKPEIEEFVPENYINDKRRILLAEDNEDLRNLIADYLSTDFEVITAENGLIASSTLKNTHIDLIISDIMMPLKDGISLCKEVKENIEFSHIPFILLTAKAGLDSKLEGADSGADIYLEKPIDFNLLRLSLRNVFKQQQQMRDYYAKNFFAESHELTTNKRESDFMRKFIAILDENLDKPEMDVNQIASELSMSRSKLYNKIKSITGNSIIEFIKSYRLRKAANLIIDTNLSMREIMTLIGIESQSYFSRSFKNEFGETPTNFGSKYKK